MPMTIEARQSGCARGMCSQEASAAVAPMPSESVVPKKRSNVSRALQKGARAF